MGLSQIWFKTSIWIVVSIHHAEEVAWRLTQCWERATDKMTPFNLFSSWIEYFHGGQLLYYNEYLNAWSIQITMKVFLSVFYLLGGKVEILERNWHYLLLHFPKFDTPFKNGKFLNAAPGFLKHTHLIYIIEANWTVFTEGCRDGKSGWRGWCRQC